MELALVVAAMTGVVLIAAAILLLQLPALPVVGVGDRVEGLGRALGRVAKRTARKTANGARRVARTVGEPISNVLETSLGVDTAEIRDRLRFAAGTRAIGRVTGTTKHVVVDTPVRYARNLGRESGYDPFRRWAIRLLVLGLALLLVSIVGLFAGTLPLSGP